MLSVLPEYRWKRSSNPCTNRLPLFIEDNNVVVVIARQVLAHFPVTDNKGIVHFTKMGDLDHVSKLCNFAVFGEFDAVGLVCTLHLL